MVKGYTEGADSVEKEKENTIFQGRDDNEFLSWVYLEFNRLMFYTAKKYFEDTRQQEEIVQESLKKLIEKKNTLRKLKRPALASYITVTVRNTSINYLKVQNEEKAWIVGLDAVKDQEKKNCRSMDDILILKESAGYLKKIWPDLEPWMRRVLEEKYFLGYTNDVIAARLGCKPNSVRMLLTRARRRAMELMKKEEGE